MTVEGTATANVVSVTAPGIVVARLVVTIAVGKGTTGMTTWTGASTPALFHSAS